MKILCVAEKNDAAKNIATQLRPSFINLIGGLPGDSDSRVRSKKGWENMISVTD